MIKNGSPKSCASVPLKFYQAKDLVEEIGSQKGASQLR
jgi:hypothetical protein